MQLNIESFVSDVNITSMEYYELYDTFHDIHSHPQTQLSKYPHIRGNSIPDILYYFTIDFGDVDFVLNYQLNKYDP